MLDIGPLETANLNRTMWLGLTAVLSCVMIERYERQLFPLDQEFQLFV